MSQLKLVSLNTWLAVAMGRLLACCGPWKIFGILCKIVRVEMILNMASFDFVCMYLSQASDDDESVCDKEIKINILH